MWEVIYTTDGIEVSFDDGNDVWLKTIRYSEVMDGMQDAFEESYYKMAKIRLSSIYGSTKEDRENGTH